MNLHDSISAREGGFPVTKPRSLAQEIQAYLVVEGEEPRFPPSPEVLSRWAKRAATLAAVRDELRQRVADLEAEVGALELINKMSHVPPPRTWVESEHLRKLRAVAEAAKDVISSVELVPGYDVPKVSMQRLKQALAALEEA